MAHWQLKAFGIGAWGIRRRIERVRLHPVMRGVYAVGRPELTRYGQWMAAALSCGPWELSSRGVPPLGLSNRSAGALWGIVPDDRATIHITLIANSGRCRPGLRIHRRPSLPSSDLTRHHNIPVTTIVRTLMDLATELDRPALERAVNEADKLERIDPESLRRELDARSGQPGVRVLRDLLDRLTFRLTDSELEQAFLPLAQAAGLPVPLTRQRVNGYRVDFHWPELGLVVEADGLRYHRTPAQQATDRRRDHVHAAAGLTPLRFTHTQVRYEPKHVIRTLRDVGATLRLG